MDCKVGHGDFFTAKLFTVLHGSTFPMAFCIPYTVYTAQLTTPSADESTCKVYRLNNCNTSNSTTMLQYNYRVLPSYPQRLFLYLGNEDKRAIKTGITTWRSLDLATFCALSFIQVSKVMEYYFGGSLKYISLKQRLELMGREDFFFKPLLMWIEWNIFFSLFENQQ